MPSLTVAGYMRVSRLGDRDPDRFRSPTFQREAIEGFAGAEKVAVEWFEPEIDVSGSKAKRPVLDSIVARIQAGELGGMVISRLDRLARLSPRDRVQLFAAVEDAGGVILSATEPNDMSTPEGRWIRETFLGLARMQWEQFRDGFDRAKAAATAQGIMVARPPIGIRKIDGKRLERDPAITPVLQKVIERRAQGAGPTELAAILERAGIPTSQGSKTWSKQTIYGLIKNRLVYLGDLEYDGQVTPGVLEPIVDVATWTVAQQPNGRTLPQLGDTSSWLLAGILRCAGCRYCMQGTNTSRGKRIYRCNGRHAGGICQSKATIDADQIERIAVDAFWRLTRDLEAQGTQDQHEDLSALRDDLDRAERLYKDFKSPAVQEAIDDPAEWASGLRERRAARDAAAAALGAARAADTRPKLPDVVTLREAWDRMTTKDHRELLALRFDAIALRREPRGVVIYPASTGPADLPRRGFKTAPVLEPFPDPPSGARVLSL